MLAGQPRIPGSKPEEMLASRIQAGLKPPPTDDLEAPGQIHEILARMIDPQPERRFATYAEVIEALKPLVA
jgi:hypothetical protein